MLISSSQRLEDYSFYERVIKNGVPIVFFDRCIEDIGASCVLVNDRGSAKKITQHLIDHGYERIAHLSGPHDVSIGKERLKGYMDALQANGLHVDDDLIIESYFDEKTGYKAMKKLLETCRPRAVVAVNDPCAYGAVKAITEMGLRIPEDIAITGFADEVRAAFFPSPLTTINQPAYQLGKRAAKKLVQTIENEHELIENIEVPTTMEVRASCGCKINDGAKN